MNFNEELYGKYRRAAGRNEKDGIWDATRFPNGLYCFATKQKLGDHGKIDEHPMLGKKFRRVKDGKVYVMDSVCIHWYNIGYYYHATLRDENGSHAARFIQNINCDNKLVLSGIYKFDKEFQMIED
jgi:hypothetical protein